MDGGHDMLTSTRALLVSNNCYIYTFAIGIACFDIVAAFMFLKIGKIEKSEALKNVE